MEVAQITLILIGGLIGFLSSIAKDYFIENKKRDDKYILFKREKLEEIFIMLNELNKNALKPIEAKVSLNGLEVKIPMVLRFYFPRLFKEYQNYLGAYQNINIANDNKIYKKAYQVFLDKLVSESHKL